MAELPATCSRGSGPGPRGDASQCPVCREPFTPDSTTVIHADCRSAVCSTCFFSWLGRSQSCAVCRGILREATAEELQARQIEMENEGMIMEDVRDLRIVVDEIIGEARLANTPLLHLGWQRRQLARHVLPALLQRRQVRLARLVQEQADTIAAAQEQASRELVFPIRDRTQAEHGASEQRFRNRVAREVDRIAEAAVIYLALYLKPEIVNILQAEPDDGTHDLLAPPS